MKRILFYDAYAGQNVTGGSSISLKRLLKHKRDKGLQYYFLTNQLNGKYYEDNIRGLGVYSLNVRFPGALFAYDKKYERGRIKQTRLLLFVILPLCIKLAYLLRKNKIDKVVCNEVRAALTIGIGVRLAGITLITFVRSDYLIHDLTTRIALKISMGIICVSEGLRGLINPGLFPRITVISDGIEYKDTMPAKEPAKINIVNVANIVPIKGQITLLKALNSLVRKHENIRCYMVGGIVDKNYFNSLKDYIKRNNLDNYVIFTGFVKEPGEYLSRASIYVQPSLYEGLPQAILEALACGVPVISSNLPGITPILKDNFTGLLFNKGDYHDLVKKIISLIDDEILRDYLANNGRKMVEEKYSIGGTIQKFEDYVSK